MLDAQVADSVARTALAAGPALTGEEMY